MSSIYRRGEVLGWGSIAVVYRGWDELLDRPVAIKELKQPFAANEPFSRSFRAQALKMLDISGRYVMATYSIDTDRNVQSVVREVAEETVGQRSFQGPMEPEVVLRLIRQILAGLDTLHGRAIIHGAVKPENIFVCGEDYKIGDFGLPAIEGEPPIPLSRFRYSSPEHVSAPDRLDRGSDIYSLGLVAYDLILGSLRFEQVVEELVREAGLKKGLESQGGEPGDLWPRFHGSPINLPSIHELEPGVPAALALTLHKMVAKDPTVRFANCKKVLASLGAAANPAEFQAGSQKLSIALSMPASAATVPPSSQSGFPMHWVWAAGGAVTLAALVVAGILAAGGHGSEQQGRLPPRVVKETPSQSPVPRPRVPLSSLAARLLQLRGTDADGLTVTFEPPVAGDPPRVELGQTLHFRVQAQSGGRLLLFALSPDGSIACLYPNLLRREVSVAGNSSLVLPSDADQKASLEFSAQGPTGPQWVFALVSSRDLPLLPKGDDSSGLHQYSSGAPARAFTDWVENLRKGDAGGTHMAALSFEIGAAH